MGLFLANDILARLEGRLGAEWLVINGQPHADTAAKFWSRFVDELAVAAPDCDGAVLRTTDDQPLGPEVLDPVAQLEQDAERCRDADLQSLLDRLINQMTLFGPPQPVHATLLSGDECIEDLDLPVEVVDSSIFPLLLASLLAWGDVPPFLWEGEHVTAEFRAEDVKREITYDFRVELCSRELAEGLRERTLELRWSRVVASG